MKRSRATIVGHPARRGSGEPDLSPTEDGAEGGIPDVGEILRRLRQQRGMSLRDVADETGLSASFIAAVERGESDIALKRLAKLAQVFNHDVGSLLGYSARQSEPLFVSGRDRYTINRGKGVHYEIIRLPGMNFELTVVTFQPKTRLRDVITHEGIDITYVSYGELVLVYNKSEYTLKPGACSVWSGAYPHTFRNDTDAPAQFVGMTETVY
jgi:transcriptional regulator with XRE-family HTH domain